MVISMAATVDKGTKPEEKVIMINDVVSAIVEAPTRRAECVELSPEADTSGFAGAPSATNVKEEAKVFMKRMALSSGGTARVCTST